MGGHKERNCVLKGGIASLRITNLIVNNVHCWWAQREGEINEFTRNVINIKNLVIIEILLRKMKFKLLHSFNQRL